jgi:hypothetical protein
VNWGTVVGLCTHDLRGQRLDLKTVVSNHWSDEIQDVFAARQKSISQAETRPGMPFAPVLLLSPIQRPYLEAQADLYRIAACLSKCSRHSSPKSAAAEISSRGRPLVDSIRAAYRCMGSVVVTVSIPSRVCR